jgi:hypothetical protein
MLSQEETLLVRDLGNVTEETEFTFEYKLKSVKELLLLKDLDITLIKKFPF